TVPDTELNAGMASDPQGSAGAQSPAQTPLKTRFLLLRRELTQGVCPDPCNAE
ncbi:hypothetical protein P7K49_016843, partial [Saguinus oedipus]